MDAVHEKGRFAFVDGLTGLCMPGGGEGGGDYVVGGTAAGDVRGGLERAVARVSSASAKRDVVLVLDQMDAWLAVGDVGVVEVMNVLVGLREVRFFFYLFFFSFASWPVLYS